MPDSHNDCVNTDVAYLYHLSIWGIVFRFRICLRIDERGENWIVPQIYITCPWL
jgi:hypothetical protein